MILGDSKREPSERLIRRNGLRGLDGLTVKELQESPGIGLYRAQRIVAVFELQRRIRSAEYRDRSAAGETFWIITDANRSATTVLMPENY